MKTFVLLQPHEPAPGLDGAALSSLPLVVPPGTGLLAGEVATVDSVLNVAEVEVLRAEEAGGERDES